MQHLLRLSLVQHRDRLQRSEGDLVSPWVAELHVHEINRHGPFRQGYRIRFLGDHRLEVEHLKNSFERHQRGHHVDPNVGQCRERAVEPGEEARKSNDGADLQRAVRGERSAYAVDKRGREGSHGGQRDKENSAVHRRDDADVTDPAGLVAKRLLFLRRTAKELDQ